MAYTVEMVYTIDMVYTVHMVYIAIFFVRIFVERAVPLSVGKEAAI